MSSENELKEGNIQQSEENEGSGEIEGYSYCNSHKGMLISPMAFFSEFNNSYQGTVIALKRLYSVLCFEEENNEGKNYYLYNAQHRGMRVL